MNGACAYSRAQQHSGQRYLNVSPPPGGFFVSETREESALLTLTCGLTFASDLMISSGATLTATLADPGMLFAGLDFADPASALGALGAGAVGRTSIQNLRDERNELSKDVRNLMDKDTGDNAWSDDDQQVYDDTVSRIEALDAKIARQQKVLDL